MRNKRERAVCVFCHHHNAPYNAARVTLLQSKGQCFAAALAEWPGKTTADQQPLAEHLQHQTGTHSAPIKYLRVRGGGLRDQSMAKL